MRRNCRSPHGPRRGASPIISIDTSTKKGVYVFVEEWASRQVWEQHMSGEAIRAFNRQLPAGTIAHIEIHPLEQIA